MRTWACVVCVCVCMYVCTYVMHVAAHLCAQVNACVAFFNSSCLVPIHAHIHTDAPFILSFTTSASCIICRRVHAHNDSPVRPVWKSVCRQLHDLEKIALHTCRKATYLSLLYIHMHTMAVWTFFCFLQGNRGVVIWNCRKGRCCANIFWRTRLPWTSAYLFADIVHSGHPNRKWPVV
jgi:hypothetical protein